jgi:glycosyltransferase involved in cell wall biosynthesis
MPSVSICIPTFNHGRFIEQSLSSATAQTFRDTEIIVLDNASEDATTEIVAAAASRDSRIRYVRHPKNIGLIGNLNACIEMARGTYIKLLCADGRRIRTPPRREACGLCAGGDRREAAYSSHRARAVGV